MPICDKCQCSFPNHVVIDGVQRNLCKRRFCLVCSPFGKRNRLDLTKLKDGNKICKTCGVFKPADEFYVYKGGNKLNPHCKVCMKKKVLEQQRALKQAAVEYLGGKCGRCGYDKYSGALVFHHRVESEKSFAISMKRGYSLTGEVKAELDKCDLVCANCHAEIHGEIQ